MKKIMVSCLYAGGMVFAVMLFVSCLTFFPVVGNGIATTKSISLANFTAVEYNGISDFVFVQTQGESKAEITIDSNLIDYIEIKMVGTTLRIEIRPMVNIKPSVHDVITIYAPSVTTCTLSGTGKADFNTVSMNSFNIINSGTGDIAMNANSIGNLYIGNSGTGNIVLTGNAQRLELNLSGTGDFDGRALTLERAQVFCSGTGNSYVRTSFGISGTLSGTGNLYYYGTGSVNVSVSGTGRVIKG